MNDFIYADNAATTKIDDQALKFMEEYYSENYGNASQPYSFARKPKIALANAREIIAECINATPSEIYFTSGGTESDNWAIKGFALSKLHRSNILTSNIEHHAILNSCLSLERLNHNIDYLCANELGIIEPNELKKKITKTTDLVSVMYANNEIGTIEPIKDLAYISHQNGAYFHTDAVQAVGHIKIDVQESGVDMLSASAHKFNGPKGAGFIYIKNGTAIKPYIDGGAQEMGMRSGTENVASIMAMAIALKNNVSLLETNQQHILNLENILLDGLKKENIKFIRNGDRCHIPGNLSLSFQGKDGEAILHRLDLMGIYVSTGSACDSVNTQISHVLKAIHTDKDYVQGTIRISLGKHNTVDDINKILYALKKILK